jgi:glucose-1-phosphate adenylyltransferase
MAAGIIFSNLNDNTLSRLTTDRTVAAVPFACRYRLVDFALSNMTNANITDINLVTNYNYRSLVDHIGSGKDWDLARRSGGINFISPYQSSKGNAKLYYTHLAALCSMQQYIDEIKDDVVVLSDCDNICNIDLKSVIAAHKNNGAEITVVTQKASAGSLRKTGIYVNTDDEGRITDIAYGNELSYEYKERQIGIFVIDTQFLKQMIVFSLAHNYESLTRDIIGGGIKNHKYMTYCYDGYVAAVSDFNDYFERSIELTMNAEARESLLGVRERPVYTKVHNSAPVIYTNDAKVKNSMIADDCVIEGTVENSILFRGVKIGKGSVVKNSILFGGTYVGEGSKLNCLVVDKNSVICDNRELSGHMSMPFYIPRKSKI